MRLPLPLHSYQLRSRTASPSRLVNCFVEQLPIGAKGPVYLGRVPGIKAWTTVGTGSIAGMHFALGKLWVVSGSKLYSVDQNKTVTEIGDIGSPGNIDMDSNASSVVVVNPPNGYYYDGSTFAQITDTDFTSRGAADVEFLDNYLLFREPDSGRFFGSDLGDETSYDALAFATAEASPDELVGMKVDHRQVLLFGENSVELWENTGASGFPFERSINGFLEMGCFNGRTIAKLDNSVFWLANDYTVRRLDGITPVRISTHAIEQAIGESTLSTAHAYTYAQDGHLFYVLSFSERTLVYDATTQLWHERETYGDTYWYAKHHASAFGLELVGDGTSNKLGPLDPETYADWSSTQRMEWTYQPVYADQQRAFHDRLEMVFEAGVGLTTGQGSDPEVMCDYSDDGGITWTSLPNRKLGKIGKYEHRVVWHSLGSARQRVYRGALSDPVKAVLVDTFVEVRGGRL